METSQLPQPSLGMSKCRRQAVGPRPYPGSDCMSSGYWIRSASSRDTSRFWASEGRCVQTATVEFYSGGERISALWRTPDTATGPVRAIVQGPGWLGLKDAKLYVRYHEALVEAGFGVLVIDYRGFGDSGGPKELSPRVQLEDLVNAVTYLTTREDVDADAIGVFGTGGTGGGNAILLAAVDARVRAAVSQVPLAAADEIVAYRPIDAARGLRTPLLVIGVEGDATTPTDHAVALYEAAVGPRRLVMQRHTTHYAAYDRYWTSVTPLIVDWFDRHVRNGGVVVTSSDGGGDVIELMEEA